MVSIRALIVDDHPVTREGLRTALELSDDLLQGTLEKPIEAEVYYLKAKALFYLDDLEGALFLLGSMQEAQALRAYIAS